MGQSAGAMSIGVLMAASKTYTENLFQKIIMMSNPYVIHYRTREEAQPYGDWLAEGIQIFLCLQYITFL